MDVVQDIDINSCRCKVYDDPQAVEENLLSFYLCGLVGRNETYIMSIQPISMEVVGRQILSLLSCCFSTSSND